VENGFEVSHLSEFKVLAISLGLAVPRQEFEFG